MVRRRVATFEKHVDLPPDLVWRIVADTERFAQMSGSFFAPYEAEERLDDAGRVVREARKEIGPFTLRWRERFGEWTEGRFLRQTRDFENGPFRRLALTVRLIAVETGTRIDGELLVTWTGPVGDLLFALGAEPRMVRAILEGYDRMISEADAIPRLDEIELPAPTAPPPRGEARRRLDEAMHLIAEGPFGHGLEGRLQRYLTEANPLDLRRLRPLELAQSWGVPGDDVVELVLAAHKAGLLSMRWEIMCPRCRGGKGATDRLSELSDEVHCESCNIDFVRDFERNVELVFAPEAWLRTLPSLDFCLIGPVRARHVRLQRELDPGETIRANADLAPGRYRLRTIEFGGEIEIEFEGGAFPRVVLDGHSVATEPTEEPEVGVIEMTNRGSEPRIVVVETTAWDEVALTGAKVMANQAFRELCPEQVLRPGDEVSIGQVAILFSDLRGSTALYERIGDTGAYALVREHFDFMTERVRANGGAIVKTIGDAVMAAFVDSADAVRAAISIQTDISEFNAARSDRAIELKIGIHSGACIAVTSKGLLDYFGTTVNQAARLQSISGGGEIVLSADVMERDAVRRAIGGREVRRERVELAGLPGSSICYRLRAGSDPAGHGTGPHYPLEAAPGSGAAQQEQVP